MHCDKCPAHQHLICYKVVVTTTMNQDFEEQSERKVSYLCWECWNEEYPHHQLTIVDGNIQHPKKVRKK